MKIPMKEMLSSIPGAFGIRLEEEPSFALVQEDGSFQLRRYEPMVIAKTTIKGSRPEAADEGFRRLATYIFGGNKSAKTMSMTTPVLQHQTLSMTTPVFQEMTKDEWTIAFVLPKDFTLETAPQPNDARIVLESVPAKTVATYRYSGNNGTEDMLEASRRLVDWIGRQNWRTVSGVKYAQYDQPFAVPFLKRNEAHVEVLEQH